MERLDVGLHESNMLHSYNRLYNRLYRVYRHFPGCTTGCTAGLYNGLHRVYRVSETQRLGCYTTNTDVGSLLLCGDKRDRIETLTQSSVRGRVR